MKNSMNGSPLVPLLLAFTFILASGCVTEPVQKVTTPLPSPTFSGEKSPVIVIGVDRDFPPFTQEEPVGTWSGFDVEAARWVAEKEGLNITFVSVPWETIVSELEAGTIDIIWSGLTITEKRLAQVNFSVPYYAVNQSIATRAGSGATMEDLMSGKLRIGAQNGSTGAEWVFKNLIETGRMSRENLIVFTDITSVTKNLESGAIDASIVQGPSQELIIKDRSLVIIGTIPVSDTYAVAFRKTNPELSARVNNALIRLMNDPYWQQLKEKYGLAGTPPGRQ